MVPCYLYPTQVLLLDDNEIFLSLLVESLSSTNFTYKSFNHPLDALNYINTQTSHQLPLINKCIESNTVAFERTALNINFSLLYQEIHNVERFNTTSIIVSDYEMPNMNGIDFFKKIKNKNLKKILLTGAADESIAVDAFNEGIIDGYIKKQPNFDKILVQQLNTLVSKFFIEKANAFLDPLVEIKKYPLAIFSNEFRDYFNKIIEKYQIVEYYLFEKIGSFVMLDNNGTIYSLHTHNEDQAESFYLEIESLDDSIMPAEFKQKIKDRKNIFCYNMAQNQLFPPCEKWMGYFQDCEQIAIENPFYCALIKGFQGITQIKDIKTFEYYKETYN